jgi:cyanophycinase-like exopeptidase
LVLVGGGDWRSGETAEIDDRLLARANFAYPIAFVPTASGSLSAGDGLLDYYAEIGGPHSYTVPILSASDAHDEENCRMLAGAGLIILGDGDGLALARTLRGTPALDGILAAFVQGALVVGMGAGAVPMGTQMVVPGAESGAELGWGWIESIVVVPQFSGAAKEPALQAALRSRAGLAGLGISEGAALALGPDGQVETWGGGEVTVVVPHLGEGGER